MVLSGHSDAGYLNKTRDHSHAIAHIFSSEDDPMPRHNGLILTISKIIKFVMYSATEAKLSAIFITAKKMVPLRQTLVEMRWLQPTPPLKNDNYTADRVTNNTIVTRQTKDMDIRFYWLRCCATQYQFRFSWAPGGLNWGNCNTKHHPPLYHEAHRHTHAG